MKEVNIEAILEEIRTEIKDKGYKKADLSFDDIAIQKPVEESPVDVLAQEMGYLNENYLHDTSIPFEAGNIVSKVMKKCIRKMVRFMFWPVLSFQNRFNASTVASLNIFVARMEQMDRRLDKIEELQKQIDTLQNRVEALEATIQKINDV
ncbi:MAG: hypothetical protein LIO99_13600 [Clostridiales bacterium]|nr:hypothetical protein [Clostridiales bacterium]MCC8107011.1 hypothetical protein [Clostridiales bacterium]